MEYNFNNEVKLFMVFDILGDTVRTGPNFGILVEPVLKM